LEREKNFTQGLVTVAVEWPFLLRAEQDLALGRGLHLTQTEIMRACSH